MTACRAPFLAIVAFIAVGAAGHATLQAPLPAAEVREELIADLGPGYRADTAISVSPDGTRVAWAGKNADRQTVFVNGQPGPGFDEIYPVKPAFSADGAHAGWTARVGKSWIVVRDGVQQGGGYPTVYGPTFALDGRLVAMAQRSDKQWVFVIDGKESAPAKNLREPVFSVLGGHIAYAAELADGWHLVLDEAPGPAVPALLMFDTATGWRPRVGFSIDGSHAAYVAQLASRKAVAVIDGTQGPPFDRVEVGRLAWTGLMFSADGRRSAYVGVDTAGGKERGTIVIDGRAVAQYQDYSGGAGSLGGVTRPAFDSAGQRFIYAAQRAKDDWAVFIDGQPVKAPPISSIQSGPVFAANGDWLLLAGSRENDATRILEIRNGEVAHAFATERGINFVESLTFDKTARRVAYVIGRGGAGFIMGSTGMARRRVIVDGEEGATYDCEDLSDLKISDDGRHVAYRVANTGGSGMRIGKSIVVLNKRAGKPYNHIFAGTLRFQPDGSVVYVARDEKRIVRVTQPASTAMAY